MRYFDVLSIVTWTEAGNVETYWVDTVAATDERRAKQLVGRKVVGFFYKSNRELTSHRVLYAGPCGSYDHLVGKRVGSFIDAAGMR